MIDSLEAAATDLNDSVTNGQIRIDHIELMMQYGRYLENPTDRMHGRRYLSGSEEQMGSHCQL